MAMSVGPGIVGISDLSLYVFTAITMKLTDDVKKRGCRKDRSTWA
jgi:hypothetical protein